MRKCTWSLSVSMMSISKSELSAIDLNTALMSLSNFPISIFYVAFQIIGLYLFLINSDYQHFSINSIFGYGHKAPDRVLPYPIITL